MANTNSNLPDLNSLPLIESNQENLFNNRSMPQKINQKHTSNTQLKRALKKMTSKLSKEYRKEVLRMMQLFPKAKRN